MAIPVEYSAARTSLEISEIQYGCGGLCLFDLRDLEDRQVGYSVDSSGTPLSSGARGTWQPAWIAVGCEIACGDPLILDTSDPAWPVLYDINGQGTWKPVRISISLDAFLRCFREFEQIARGRGNPVQLDANPVSENERRGFLDKVSDINNGKVDLEFWGALLQY